MELSLSLGWWMVPAVVTGVLLLWAIPMRDEERPTGGMFDGLGYPMGLLIRGLAAGCASLAAWFVWAMIS